MNVNVEIKARATREQQDFIRDFLMRRGAKHVGRDRQVDTYFKVPTGRLKVRDGTIEHALVQYVRPDQAGPKLARCEVVTIDDPPAVVRALTAAVGVLATVSKRRDIYWLTNIKVHLDDVEGLGLFVEIEAQSHNAERTEDGLRAQCEAMMREFGILPDQLHTHSYSDMVLARVVGETTDPAGVPRSVALKDVSLD